MDDRRLERIEKKLDDVADHLASIDTTLALQHASLEHHIRRTDILEEQVKPIVGVKKAVKAVTVMGALAAALIAILKFIKAL